MLPPTPTHRPAHIGRYERRQRCECVGRSSAARPDEARERPTPDREERRLSQETDAPHRHDFQRTTICPTPLRLAERNEHPTMGIADIVVSMDKVRKGPPCTVCGALNSLDSEDAAALTRLLSDPLVRYSELSDALASEGLDLSAGTLSRHARGRCEARTKLRGA